MKQAPTGVALQVPLLWGLGSWWGVDLGVSVPAASIVILNLASNLAAATAVRFGDLAPLDFGLANPVCAATAGASNTSFFSCNKASGRFLTVESQAGLFFCEVQVYAVPPSKCEHLFGISIMREILMTRCQVWRRIILALH